MNSRFDFKGTRSRDFKASKFRNLTVFKYSQGVFSHNALAEYPIYNSIPDRVETTFCRFHLHKWRSQRRVIASASSFNGCYAKAIS